MGPCAKVRVFCTLVHPDGRRWVGENIVANPQKVCPRGDLPSGVGYDLCRSVCEQVGHAEVVALDIAGADAVGCTAYVEGRDYICTSCQDHLLRAGVRKWVMGSPPTNKAEFLAHLQRASDVVATWPSWKQGMYAPHASGSDGTAAAGAGAKKLFGYAVEQADGHVTFFKEDPTGFRHKKWEDVGTAVHTLYSGDSAATSGSELAPAQQAATCQPLADELAAKLTAAVAAEYPIPDNPHASVIQRATDNRAAMWRGINVARALAHQSPSIDQQGGAPDYWLEWRPEDGGRWVVHESQPDKIHSDITPVYVHTAPSPSAEDDQDVKDAAPDFHECKRIIAEKIGAGNSITIHGIAAMSQAKGEPAQETRQPSIDYFVVSDYAYKHKLNYNSLCAMVREAVKELK